VYGPIKNGQRHQFPPEIIQYAVWLHHRFKQSHRDVEDLLAQRGTTVSYQAIRLWCSKFGSKCAQRLGRKHQGYGDTFFIDEVCEKIHAKQHYLWSAVDQGGGVVDVFLKNRGDAKAAKRFFGRLLRKHRGERRKIFMDKLRSYRVAQRELIHDTIHDAIQYANN